MTSRGPDRKQLAAEAAGRDAERHIDKAVDHQHPHRREMPKQRAGEPAAERDRARKGEGEQRRGVVDLPARADHHQHGDGVDPMRDAHPERMNRSRRSAATCERDSSFRPTWRSSDAAARLANRDAVACRAAHDSRVRAVRRGDTRSASAAERPACAPDLGTFAGADRPRSRSAGPARVTSAAGRCRSRGSRRSTAARRRW